MTIRENGEKKKTKKDENDKSKCSLIMHGIFDFIFCLQIEFSSNFRIEAIINVRKGNDGSRNIIQFLFPNNKHDYK